MPKHKNLEIRLSATASQRNTREFGIFPNGLILLKVYPDRQELILPAYWEKNHNTLKQSRFPGSPP